MDKLQLIGKCMVCFYSWYNKDGSKVLKRYEKWKKEQNK